MRRAAWLLAAVVWTAGAGAPGSAEEGDRPAAQEEAEEEGRGPDREGRAPGPEEEREILAFIKQHNPEMAGHIHEARERKPELYRHKLKEFARMYRNPEMRQVFVRNMKSEARVRKAVEAYRRADGGEKESLKGELEAALNEQFDAKLAGHEMHLKRMQEEIARQKDRIAKRRSLKDKIVKKRLAEVSGDVEAWDW